VAFDIHYEAASTPKGLRIITFGAYPTVLGVEGAQKMVNRFVKCFLTPRGSDVSDLDYGTQLAGVIGGTVDFSMVYAYAVAAVNDTTQKIQEYDTLSELPDDERLAGAGIEEVQVRSADRSVTLRLRLTNVAGSSVAFLLPELFQTT
jgi:hypothetical protein